MRLPEHVAVIMDGNGRWARLRGLPRAEGHRRGVDVARKIVRHASQRGIRVLTLYAFSTENWRRPSVEVSLLMRLLKIFAKRERPELVEQNVQFKMIGDLSRLPAPVRAELERTQEATSLNTGMILQLALSYSGRDEILRAVQKITASGASPPKSEEEFSAYLDTAGRPDVDLVVRTSGEERLSNFLIWQAAYAEFYFTERLWPEFDEGEFDRALADYAKRERRYGALEPPKVHFVQNS